MGSNLGQTNLGDVTPAVTLAVSYSLLIQRTLTTLHFLKRVGEVHRSPEKYEFCLSGFPFSAVLVTMPTKIQLKIEPLYWFYDVLLMEPSPVGTQVAHSL